MTVLRHLGAVLEPTTQAVLEMDAKLDEAGIANRVEALRKASGQALYNTSKFTLWGPKDRDRKCAQIVLRQIGGRCGGFYQSTSYEHENPI